MTDSSDAAALDLSRAPRGELVAAQLVEAVAVLGDFSERHYLELKGPRSLGSKVDKQKVAKFILGAANRLPEKAAEAFEGYCVMIVGITDRGVEGIPPIEMLELSKVVQPFLGAAGPRWDIVRVPIENSTNQVLVVLVDPPRIGQEPFICRDNGEGLQSGRIYYRGEGATREPDAGELDLLMARGAAQPTAPVDLAVEIVGRVTPVAVDDARPLEEYIATTRRRLLAALPQPVAPPAATELPRTFAELAGMRSSMSQMLAGLSEATSLSALGTDEPEKRTKDQYLAEIDKWERAIREAWPTAVELFMAYALPASEIKVTNKTDTFLHDLEITLHLEGPVQAIEHEWCDDDGPAWRDLGLPHPPRKWGPTKRDFNSALLGNNWAAFSAAPNLTPRAFVPPNTSWNNTGSVTIGVQVGDLRPKRSFESDDEESILVIRGEVPDTIKGTWEATVRDYNQVFTGDTTVEVADAATVTDLLRDFLGPE